MDLMRFREMTVKLLIKFDQVLYEIDLYLVKYFRKH